MNSELVISTNPKRFAPQLRAYEVYSRKNSTSLVVLSACNTGAGELARGEGVFNIARAFLLAGVHNVVLTQWPVADQSSATLMDRYYYYLSEGYATDIALQRSKIDFLTFGDPVKGHPYYWTAYVNVGNPFEFPVRRSYWYLWLILLVAAGGFLYFRIQTRSKHS
jgi:CHAT domain-containing protein